MYFKRSWYPEAFYMLSMVDYLCRIHNYPIVENYDTFRCGKLEKPVYPIDVVLMDEALGTNKYRIEANSKAIPEFKRFNLMEPDVRAIV